MKANHLILLAAAGASLAPLLASAADNSSFVPLTAVPIFTTLSNADSIAGFLNGLYKICIGAAAALAVIQIFRAGMEFMLNTGSFTHNEKAKDRISGAIFGLLLVLSPAIVFGIIDPRILDLKLDASSLQLNPVQPAPTIGGTQPGTRNGDVLSTDQAVAMCNATPNCRAVDVNTSGGTLDHRECSCETRAGAGSTDQGDTGGRKFNTAITGAYDFSPTDFVFIATTFYDIANTDHHACYAVWGGAFATQAQCEQKRSSEQGAHGSAAGYHVLSDCAHVATEIQVTGACVPPITDRPVGDLSGFN